MSDLMPRRIQLSRKKGFKFPPNTVKVDRSTKWGNPWRVGMTILPLTGPEQGKEIIIDQARAVKMFKTGAMGKGPAAKIFRDMVCKELRGKNLACWCKPGTPCHGDVLLEIANNRRGESDA